ncbi:MAG TPA: N-acetyltransferase [Oceanospirillales bacterium]|nr:N-acetyltransferase [Oceanospirillales bacterium]
MTITIRKEQNRDIKAIEKLTEQAFRGIEHSSHTEQFIVAALRRAKALSISLVAELNSEIIGHVAVSPVKISDGSKNWFGLGPISVLPKYQQQGIGSLLMTATLKELDNLEASGCVLLGDPEFYRRFGFVAEAAMVLADVPPEYFQALLIKGTLPKGTVTYHQAFSAQD